MSTRVWKYCRQAHLDDGLPMITAQNEMLDAYIAKHGYILAGETIALENGTQRDRNSIKEIIRQAENKNYDILLISHLDRLMRDTIPCMELCRELLEMGIRIIPVKSGMEFTMKMIEPYSFIKEAQKNRYKHHAPRSVACGVCGKNPMTVQGCRIGMVYVNGQLYPRIPFYGDPGERCHDCNALSGHFHHWGCDDEICPVCGGQLIGCDCEGVECPTIV